MKRGLFKGYVWSRRRLTEVPTTTRPDHVWPEVWTNLSKAAKMREIQGWAIEKSRLEKARKMRGIHFIDTGDKAYEETLKNASRKLEVHVEAAMPRKKKNPRHFFSFRKL